MASLTRTLAVDLGASAVRLLEVGADAKGRPAVLALGEEEIPYDPAKTSDFFPIYAQALASILTRWPSKTRKCSLCVGGPAVFARILKIPAADPAKVASMIGFEAQQTVPAIEQALWDSQVVPSPQGGEVEALILAIKRETVDELSAAASSVGLEPQSVTLAPAAILNAFLYNYPEADGCHLLLDIGARATTIVLVEARRFFIRVVPLGGAAITQAVATDLQESFAGAEVLKKAKGFVHPGGAYEDPADAASARISKLARGVMTRLHTEVERSVTFFRSQQGGSKPTRVLLLGGGAGLPYTDLFFQEKLKIPVESFQPFRRLTLSKEGGHASLLRGFPLWSVAVGTGLQATIDAPVKINVLGAAGRAAAEKSKNQAAVILGSVFLTALCLLPGIHGLWMAAKMQDRLSTETQRVEEASQALAKLEAANKKFSTTAKAMEQAQVLEEERMRWPRLLDELRRHAPQRLWITGLKVVNGPEISAGTTPPGKPAPSQAPLLEIQGMFQAETVKDYAEAVENFQKALTQGGVLQNVTVLEREAPQYREGKTDQVALKFKLQADWPLAAGQKRPPRSPGP